jgi:hypothetical protein
MQVIIVPPGFTITEGKISSNQSYAEITDVAYNSHVNLNGVLLPVIHPRTHHNRNFVYDPLTDYTSWYIGHTHNAGSQLCDRFYLTQVLANDIPLKLWHSNELNCWLSSHASPNVVLVQRTIMGWNIVFSDAATLEEFSEWWTTKTLEHSMYIALPLNRVEHTFEVEVQNWCKQHLNGQWTSHRVGGKIKLSVKDQNEAVLAKLTFDATSDW